MEKKLNLKSITISYVVFLLSCISQTSISQSPQWKTLPSSPVSNSFRFEDIFFINETTGWICSIAGKIYKTTNGGESWDLVMNNSFYPFRSLGFSDSLRGYAGLYYRPGNSMPMLKTTNGGQNWEAIQNVSDPVPAGICGISVVNNDVIWGVGKIDRPASAMRSTDGGNSWLTFDFTGIASKLVDCHFFSKDSGFVFGGIQVTSNMSTDVILFTSNGGTSWENRFTGFQTGMSESCWKINFINKQNAVVSLNHTKDSLSFLKSTDGGVNWIRFAYRIPSSYFTQGIGFVNESLGWLGGGTATSYQTTDGGLSWFSNPFGESINRIQFLNDTVGYAAGAKIYKYSTDTIVGIQNISINVGNIFKLEQNYPNPFNPSTTIDFEVPEESFIKVAIYNSLGKQVKILINNYVSSGVYQATWDGKNSDGVYVSSGLYFYRLEANKYSVTKKMMLLK